MDTNWGSSTNPMESWHTENINVKTNYHVDLTTHVSIAIRFCGKMTYGLKYDMAPPVALMVPVTYLIITIPEPDN